MLVPLCTPAADDQLFVPPIACQGRSRVKKCKTVLQQDGSSAFKFLSAYGLLYKFPLIFYCRAEALRHRRVAAMMSSANEL